MSDPRTMTADGAGGAGLLETVRLVAADIKVAHSVFALPFAVLAAFMAAAPPGETVRWPRFGGQLALVVVAMVLARTVAMIANRLLDREIDRRNPRTAGRAFARGALSPRRGLTVLLLAAAGFVAICAGFGAAYANWWPLILSIPVLAWISAYALLKRFTLLCHAYLGSSLAISPLAAALAVDPAAPGTQAGLWLLAGAVLAWVAGFDVIYALQDVEIDRRDGLHSLPSRLGPVRALWFSRLLHAGAAAALIATAWIDPRFGAIFAGAVALVLVLLVYEHATVARWGTTRLALAFFTLNGVISCVLGAAGVADVLV